MAATPLETGFVRFARRGASPLGIGGPLTRAPHELLRDV